MTAPTNSAAWFTATSVAPPLTAPEVQVVIDGHVESRVCLETIEMEIGHAPRATFSVGLGRRPGGMLSTRLEDVAPTIQPGLDVRARLLRGGLLAGAARRDLVLFEGRIVEVGADFGPDGETLRFEAEDLAADVLRRRVGGQRIETAAGGTGLAVGFDLVFNPDGRPNASSALYDPGDGDPYGIFAPASPPGATAWTLNEAVAYLLGEYAASDAWRIPSCGWVRQVLDAVAIRDVTLEGRPLGEAIETLLEPVGGRLLVVVEPGALGVSRSLELWLPSRARRVSLAHQPVGSVFNPVATHFSNLGVQAHFAASPRRYVARGDRKIFESTFDLVPGWDDSLASFDPDAFCPSKNPDFDAVRDVFRKWVLNEAGEYSEAPYNWGAAPDLSALFEGDSYVRRHRRFLPCLSRDVLGRSRGVYVELSVDGSATWQRLHAAAQVLTNEAGLYLTDDPLPPEYLLAAMQGDARVRVTAALESDSCLVATRVAEGTGTLPGRTRYLHVPAGHRYRKRAASSRFHGDPVDEADDSSRLQSLVDAAFDADRRCPVPSRIRTPYLVFGRRVGECVAGIRGRRLDLAGRWAGYETDPVIRRVWLRLWPAPETELELD